MTIGCLRNMMDFLRNKIHNYCANGIPTLDEIEILADELLRIVYNIFCPKGDEKLFKMLVRKFVKDEILRACNI